MFPFCEPVNNALGTVVNDLRIHSTPVHHFWSVAPTPIDEKRLQEQQEYLANGSKIH